ncbi:rhodanese-like domain-containing protein [Rhodobaculum claviforme]|uniref:Rhodanese n=1 Tax=Rhodobaculum claviforme TaxID=1549854 RepID=A0A934TI83_9RHOB|nr:rhodanese-like domain-containing protein [Rhodobaculum claviforme]MBK5926153.1 rhodanese [Rhodobaculum claviforme]
MPQTLQQMIDAANAVIPKIDRAQAEQLMADGALVVDVRDAPEVVHDGKVAGARHVSRGMLEFRADPASPLHEAAFDPERPVVVYCAAGGRAALAGKTLHDLGYTHVFNLGAFKDWVAAGGAVESPMERGM